MDQFYIVGDIGFEVNFSTINDNEPYYIKPYKARVTLSIDDCAGILADNDPNSRNSVEFYQYRDSILDAVRNNILQVEHADYDINGNLIDGFINKNKIGKWAKKNNYDWSLPIDNEDDPLQENDSSELKYKINQLEQELADQKKNNSEFVYIPQLDIADADNLERENDQLKIDNQKLTEQLDNANKEIEKLKKHIPILLGQYKNDDLLLLAIQARDKYWGNYTDTDPNPNYKSLSSEQIRRSIKKEFNHLSDRELIAIEIVSCPINRKK